MIGQVLTLPKLQLHAKLQRNSMKGCQENPWQTNKRTGLKTEVSFDIVGGLKKQEKEKEK